MTFRKNFLSDSVAFNPAATSVVQIRSMDPATEHLGRLMRNNRDPLDGDFA
ncbi:hypothetical protein [Streptomyces sp. AM 2-1-1]|uniref:hypothetical protein n=1 Tax=Streptomyces sp. AM 2-1-1 TaxID=3028709 RepID=UPI0023B8DA02|nr:hypothetical protein [Streptomyces sp. AM 2-1-1]WEH38077.1 hypothetical protein PZB77_00310 [Streptomyces sp. AM 2-1-1]